MTTHLRARAAQAVGLLALVVGGLAVTPAAALATAPTVTVNGVQPDNVLSGGKVTLQFTVINNNGGLGGGGDDQNSATISVSGGGQCGDCPKSVDIAPGQPQTFTVHVTMPQVSAGQSQKFTLNVSASFNKGKDQGSDQAQVTVQGPDKPQSVRAITGKVKDTSGKGVSGARVGAQDSAGRQFETVTNGSGSFSILSTDSNAIAPGNIQVGAGKDGFAPGTVVSVQGEAGKTVNVSLTLKPLQASSSASASATPSTTGDASLDPGSVLSTNTAVPSINLQSDAATKNTSQDSGSGSTLFVVLGGLLVAAGIGAIVLVLMRRRNATKGPDGPDGDPTAMGGGPGVVPPSQGRFTDATRVGGAPIGGMGNPAAATMVAPRSGAPSMADAPTMLHRPVPAAPEDEFPDPYGAPLPPQGGYAGAPAGGWDDQGAGQYAAPNQYGQADDYAAPGQYPAGNGQYGGGQYAANGAGQERFDEHTSLYQPESEPDGYGDYDQGGYGGGAGGGQYGGNGGGAYGGGAAEGDGAAVVGAGAGGAGQYGGGQYGGGAYGGGRQDDGYGAAGGYQSGGGYGQEQPEPGGYGSWGAPAGGIDSGSGYGPQGSQGGGGQYGAGAYGGGAGGAVDGGAGGTYGGAGGAGQYGGGAGAGYDDRGGYDQGYEQPQQGGGQYGGAGGQYGAGNARPPQQPGGGYGYEQPEEENGGYGARRGYEDDQQPSRRGSGRRPGGY